jgi:O-antigen ligase
MHVTLLTARINSLIAFFALLAPTLPTLLAHNITPSPTYLNQALAFGLWGAMVAIAAWSAGGVSRPAPRGLWPRAPAVVLGLLMAAVLASWLGGSLPSTLALAALGTLVAALLLLRAGQQVSAPRGNGAGGRADLFVLFCWGWLLAGVLNVAIALVQVFAPTWADGQWIAASGLVGRAVGNLRQPNHLSSVLMWSAIAVVTLLQLRRIRFPWAAVLVAALVFAVVLTASRTGLASVLLLALWGLLDGRARREVRGLLLAAPLLYAASWLAMAQWARATQQAFGGAARLAETDISSSRFAIWRDTLELIAQQPWFGVGWGRFNLAWTLTPSPDRPIAFFDHAHNLTLHWAAELGLPLALLLTVMLLASIARAGWRGWHEDGEAGAVRRGAVMVVLMIGLHSQFEYPLWYSYFLLPAAFAWGVALREPAALAAAGGPGRPALPFILAGSLLVAGAAFSVWDYLRVSAIFRATPGAPPLVQRIRQGQASVFFGHHADYAAVTSNFPVPDRDAAFQRAAHHLLDTRLMMAWSQELADTGRIDPARHLAARLREFRRGESANFFAPCALPGAAASAADSFQCQAAEQLPRWTDFVTRTATVP